MERIRIETGTRAPNSVGATTWATSSAETRWCEAVWVSPDEAMRRYDMELDDRVYAEFRFRDKPTITMGGTRFVWVSDGHSKEGCVFYPRSGATNIDGRGRWTRVLVEESEEGKILFAGCAISATAAVEAVGAIV